jgi:hypothetical protein
MIKSTISVKKMIELAPDCRCRACETGCRFGSGFLAENDLQNISKFLGMSEEEVKQNCMEEVQMFNTLMFRPKLEKQGKPYGKCTFFDEDKGCVVNAVKPLQCKIATGCKGHGDEAITWFYLKYAVNSGDPESIRQWAEYLKHHKIIPGAELFALIPDEVKLRQIMNYEILR